MHFLIYKEDLIVGIISGASAVYAVRSRDEYFGITTDNRHQVLPAIIDNVVFRLEDHTKNLGTQVLSEWRKKVCVVWKRKYNVEPIGFETFVIPTKTRQGAVYKADNWLEVGITAGSCKFHLHGIEKEMTRQGGVQKLIFCKKVKGVLLPKDNYESRWSIKKGKLKQEIFAL